MAYLKGPGSMTGVNLIARVYDTAKTKDGKTVFADVQLDSRDPRGKDQTNLHLVSRKSPEGNYQYGAAYSAGQMEQIQKVAGTNVRPILSKDGENLGTAYAVKANVMPSSRGPGLVINTKSLAPADFELDSNYAARQIESSKAAKAAKDAKASEKAQETQAEAPVQQTEAAVAVHEAGPEVG